jgi:hypothetical protein
MKYRTNTAAQCNNITAWRSDNGVLQTHVYCEGLSVVGTRRAVKSTPNAGDTVARYQERTTAVCYVEFQTVYEIQLLNKTFNWVEKSCS